MKNLYSTLLFLFILVCSRFIAAQTITKENVQNTENIIDLQFSDAERDSMLGSLEEQKGNYKKIREIELNNSVMPSILFNPIPPGFVFPKEQKPLKFSDYSKTKMPVNKNELAYFTIGQLAELIRTKQITSTELTTFFIDRLKKYDPVLHCVIAITEERALHQATVADEEISAGKYRGIAARYPFCG